MSGMEMSPSGRIIVIRDNSRFFHTVISNSSSGPRRNPAGASYSVYSTGVAGLRQPAWNSIEYSKKLIEIVLRWRIGIHLTCVYVCWSTRILLLFPIDLEISPSLHSERQPYRQT